MRTRLEILATVTALAGHLVGVVGFPLPSTSVEKPPAVAVTKKADRTCRCACGGGCGEVCCCCGGTAAPAEEPATEQNTSWHWVASIQMQKCRGIGPSGLPDLPPGLPLAPSMSYGQIETAVDSVHVSQIDALIAFGRPPTPPPRFV